MLHFFRSFAVLAENGFQFYYTASFKNTPLHGEKVGLEDSVTKAIPNLSRAVNSPFDDRSNVMVKKPGVSRESTGKHTHLSPISRSFAPREPTEHQQSYR